MLSWKVGKLSSRQFQDTQNGDLFYNFFVYQYPADKEYEIRQQIKEFKEQLIRPINYVDVLTMNLFEEFCNFLDSQSFGKLHPSYLKYLIEKDGSNPDSVTKTLTNKANSDAFYEFVHNKIIQHISIKDDKIRQYVSVPSDECLPDQLREVQSEQQLQTDCLLSW